MLIPNSDDGKIKKNGGTINARSKSRNMSDARMQAAQAATGRAQAAQEENSFEATKHFCVYNHIFVEKEISLYRCCLSNADSNKSVLFESKYIWAR
ncbi:hypothetical protein Ciccas_000003 [Cichlidogyrus casuarinus]|uniref:Small EDRK-rich factor-like N-terminal domain-containing protein n=1 Tax=Cichlidogyrus casuarinus TaxID=1844966 RepID=A0ABD2QRJ8_9PLAT